MSLSLSLSVRPSVCFSVRIASNLLASLSVCQFICTSVHMSVLPFIRLCKCLYGHLPLFLSVYLSVRLIFVFLFPCGFIYPCAYICCHYTLVHEFIHLYICLLVCLSIHISVCPSVPPSSVFHLSLCSFPYVYLYAYYSFVYICGVSSVCLFLHPQPVRLFISP